MLSLPPPSPPQAPAGRNKKIPRRRGKSEGREPCPSLRACWPVPPESLGGTSSQHPPPVLGAQTSPNPCQCHHTLPLLWL